MKKGFLSICCFVIFVISVMCSKSTDTINNDILLSGKQIHNSASLWKGDSKIELEFVKRIGGLDVENENYLFYKIRDVVEDNNKNIYVVDNGNQRVQKFDYDGRYLVTFGSKGEGPGELLNPQLIDVDSNGNLYVYDSGNRRVQKYSSLGSDIGSFRYQNVIRFLRISSNDEIITSSSQNFSGIVPKLNSLISILNNQGNVIRELGIPVSYNDNTILYIGNTIYCEIDDNDNIFVAFKFLNRIEKYLYNGKKVFESDRPLNFETPINPDMISMGGMSAPNFPFVSDGIAVDGKGRAWILTFRKERKGADPNFKANDNVSGDLKEFHIFDSEGNFLGSIPLPIILKTFRYRIFENRLYVIDNEKEICVIEYKIIEK